MPNDLHGRLRLAYAAICVVAGASMAVIYHGDRGAWQHGVADRYILYYAGFFFAFAIALLTLGNWAEIAFAAVTALMGVAFVIAAGLDWKTAPEAMTTSIPVGLVLMVPAVVVMIAIRRGEFFSRGV
jgi:heme/copper-type cytochrome/quinol oxidase subunit 3